MTVGSNAPSHVVLLVYLFASICVFAHVSADL